MTPKEQNKSVVDDLVERDGDMGADQPPVVKVVRFTNQYGGVTYGLVLATDAPTKYDRELDAETYWEASDDDGD